MSQSETKADVAWKEKYFAELERYEREERHWRRVEELFKRALSRVALAAEGTSAELDAQLGRLRDTLRQDTDPALLAGQLESLSALLRDVESGGARARSPGGALAQILEDLPWPRALRREAKQLRKTLGRARYSNELAAPAEQAKALLARALQLPEATPEAGSGGLFSALFARKARLSSPAAHDVTVEGACGVLERLLAGVGDSDEALVVRVRDWRAQLQETATAADLDPLVDELATWFAGLTARPKVSAAALSSADSPPNGLPLPNELIIELLERLSLPAELDANVAALRERLLGPVASWAEILQGVCDLVAEMRLKVQKEKEDLEDFLGQLTSRLLELDERVEGTREDQEASRRSGEALGVAVAEQVTDIAQSMDGVADPDQLKRIIQARLEKIRRHVDAYREAEAVRRRQADERMQTLTQRLRELEEETSSLRQRIHQQRDEALRDSLTGICNRLAYDERIEQEFVRWKRFQEPLSIIVWDVDHFKRINDTYGHKAGDKVLASIAKLLASQIRESDFIGRYGGEEFVIIAPGCGVAASVPLAEKLRQSVQQKTFKYRDTVVPVSVSCGIAEFRAGLTPDRVFEAADKALYRAKANGRNRCEVDQ
jgi:diguanylate cyclase